MAVFYWLFLVIRSPAVYRPRRACCPRGVSPLVPPTTHSSDSELVVLEGQSLTLSNRMSSPR